MRRSKARRSSSTAIGLLYNCKSFQLTVEMVVVAARVRDNRRYDCHNVSPLCSFLCFSLYLAPSDGSVLFAAVARNDHNGNV